MTLTVYYVCVAIHTAAMDMLGGSEVAKQCRKPEICADAAYAILTKDSKSVTGNFFIDDEVSMFIDYRVQTVFEKTRTSKHCMELLIIIKIKLNLYLLL